MSMSMPLPASVSALARDFFDCQPNIGRVPVPQTPGLGAVPDIGELKPLQTWSGHTA